MKRSLRSRSLVGSVWRTLEDGPVAGPDLARSALGLRGDRGAAAAAIFALVGGDDRFQVDGDGLWSIRPGARKPGTPLSEIAYAVVDVETTGGSYDAGHRITEIAIIQVRGGAVVDQFQTLVQPYRRVPPRIERLTGITNGMLQGAPTFQEIAGDVARRLRNRIFVAHNVAFDWGWVQRELKGALGKAPEPERLCTVRLARRLIPGLASAKLDAVASRLGISIPQRHRAWGDAQATARILIRLLDRAALMGACDLHSLGRCRVSRREVGQGDLFASAGT